MISVCRPFLNGNEKKYVNDCLDTNWIGSSGKYVTEFENKFAEYCECKYGATCSNGTTALHLALLALGIGEGDEVICPNFSIISTTNAILQVGAKPIFVDSDITTWNIDVEKIEKEITHDTAAIMVVHTYGCPVDMDKVNNLAKKYDLKVIEDCAEAHGATYKGKKVGSLGDIACFSFFSNKIITTGEGGMVISNDKELIDKVKYYRNLCFKEPRFLHSDFGFNYRMTNIQCAMGVAQLEKIEEYVNARISNAKKYDERLEKVDGVILPPKIDYGRNVYWMYGIMLDDSFPMKKEEFVEYLKMNGIETRSFFCPMHLQEGVYYNILDVVSDYSVSQEMFEKGLYLPSSSDLTDEEIDYICTTIEKVKK